MDLTALLVSMVSMGGLGALFSAGLSLANKRLQVVEDPRIREVTEALPGANCGACGYAGCAHYAEKLVSGEAELTACNVASSDAIEEIAGLLGIEPTITEPKVARIMCQGGLAEATRKAEYIGIQSCLAADLMVGGEKQCSYGCLGYGDCIDSCPFDALYLNDNGLPVVVEDRCTGCGKCVDACPRGVIELHPKSHRLFILCKNHDAPKEARRMCTKACIGCQICVRAVSDGQIIMDDNLAVIDYNLYGQEATLPTDRCPTDCLVVFENQAVMNEEVSPQ
ncbi:MAG: RnfABCDGE type electron transport complex subunit B [Candidatus Neomarinimicrobiota bacterium]